MKRADANVGRIREWWTTLRYRDWKEQGRETRDTSGASWTSCRFRGFCSPLLAPSSLNAELRAHESGIAGKAMDECELIEAK